MTAAKQLIDMRFLRTLVPLGDLHEEQLQRLMGSYSVELVESGTELFSAGDNDAYTYYLLSGQISLKFKSGSERTVRSQTTQARYALVPERPRTASAITESTSTVLQIDKELLDELVSWNERQGLEVNEIESGNQNDWMTRYLQSKVFLRLRAKNIQALMMRLEEVPVKAGQVIIRQGDDDGYYYIIKSGHCQVTRQDPDTNEEVELAELTVGTGFGEEAIITHSRRGATVSMLDNGCLMRLSRDDFRGLLVEPLIEDVIYKEALAVENMVFLDVREPDEYTEDGITGAENIILTELRPNIDKLDSSKTYIAYSNHSHRAAAAAFLICQQGINGQILRGGLAGVPAHVPRGNQSGSADDNIPVVDNIVNFAFTQKVPKGLLDNAAPIPKRANSANGEGDHQVHSLFDYEIDNEIDKAFDEEADKVVDQKHDAEFDEQTNDLLDDDANNEHDRRRLAEKARQDAEQEIARLKAEVQKNKRNALLSKKRAALSAQKKAEKTYLESERKTARLRDMELGAKQAEMEEVLRQAEEEALRASQAEMARRQAQLEADELREQAQKALADAEREAAKTEEVMKQVMREQVMHEQYRKENREVAIQAAQEIARADLAERAHREAVQEIERLKAEVASSQSDLADKTRLAAEHARNLAEEQSLRAIEKIQQEQDDIRKQAQLQLAKMREEFEVAKGEEEARRQQVFQAQIDDHLERVREAEAAQLRTEQEMLEFKEKTEIERYHQAQAALLAAEEAHELGRSEANRQLAETIEEKQAEIDRATKFTEEIKKRAIDAEQARDAIQKDLERLTREVQTTEEQMQSQLSADTARSEIEHEVARARAIELANKQQEIEEVTHRADEEFKRAQMAEQAKLAAAQEIANLKAEIEQVRLQQMKAVETDTEDEDWNRRRDEEIAQKEAEIAEVFQQVSTAAERAQQAELAQQKAEKIIKRLRAEMEVATHQAQLQLEANTEYAIVREQEHNQIAQNFEIRQAEIAALTEKMEQEQRRAQEAEQACLSAEQVLEQLRESAEEGEKARIELEKVRADLASKQIAMDRAANRAKKETLRAQEAERSRLVAEEETRRVKKMAIDERNKANKAIEASLEAKNSITELIAERAAKHQPKEPQGLSLKQVPKSQWVSDQVLWETTLGMREDQAVLDLVEPSKNTQDTEDEWMDSLFTDISTEQPKGFNPLQERKSERRTHAFTNNNDHRASFPASEVNLTRQTQTNVRYYVGGGNGLAKKLVVTIFSIVGLSMVGMYFTMSNQQQASIKEQVKQRWSRADNKTHEKPISQSIVSLKSGRRPVEKIEERVSKQRKNAEKAWLNRRTGVYSAPVEPTRSKAASRKIPSLPPQDVPPPRRVIKLVPPTTARRVQPREAESPVTSSQDSADKNFSLIEIDGVDTRNEEVGVGASTLFHETESLVNPYDNR